MKKRVVRLTGVVLLMVVHWVIPITGVHEEVHAAVGPAAKIIDKLIHTATQVSGRGLSGVSREAARTQIGRVLTRYGDDALLGAVRRGGIELVEAAARYGDDVWKYAAQVPEGAVALATRTAEVLPLARRVGPEALRLEAKMPGIASPVASAFGDKAVPYFHRSVPTGDMARLVRYAQKADTPQTRALLLSHYKKGGSTYLDRLDWKRILAGGLSASMVISAYKISDGVEEGLKNLSANNPDMFSSTLKRALFWPMLPFVLAVSLLGCGRALIHLVRHYRRSQPTAINEARGPGRPAN